MSTPLPPHGMTFHDTSFFSETLSLNLLTSHLIPLNTELNPICHLLALLGCATIVVVSRLRAKLGGVKFSKNLGATLNFYAVEG